MNIPTAQVIIGKNIGGIFDTFEGLRQTAHGKALKPTDPTIQQWYAEALTNKAIFLSTIENSDVISFTHKFNKGSVENQGLFVVEVIDPTNTFEARFMTTFFAGQESYLELLTSRAGLNMAQMGEVTSWQQTLDEHVRTVGNRPFEMPMMITFGMGEDPRNWAPVQKCTLVAADYGLTSEGVKKLTLKFVPNPGLLRFEASEETSKSLTGGDKTEFRTAMPLFKYKGATKATPDRTFPGKRDPGTPIFVPTPRITIKGTPFKPISEIELNHPFGIIEELVKQAYAKTTKSQTVVILNDLHGALNRRWSQACINATKQFIAPLIKATLDSATITGEDWNRIAAHLWEQLASEDDTTARFDVDKEFGPIAVAKTKEVDPLVTTKWRGLLDSPNWKMLQDGIARQEEIARELWLEKAGHRTHWVKDIDYMRAGMDERTGIFGAIAALADHPGKHKSLISDYEAAMAAGILPGWQDPVEMEVLASFFNSYPNDYFIDLNREQGIYFMAGGEIKAGLRQGSVFQNPPTVAEALAWERSLLDPGWIERTGSFKMVPAFLKGMRWTIDIEETAVMKAAGVEDALNKAAYEFFKAQGDKAGERWHSLDPAAAFEAKMGVRNATLISTIKIAGNDINRYKIYVAAAIDFYGSLGFDVITRYNGTEYFIEGTSRKFVAKTQKELNQPGGGITAHGMTVMTGKTTDPGSDNGEKIADLVAKSIHPIDIGLHAKSINDLKIKVQGLLGTLNQGSKFEPYTTCFSEISLVKRCKQAFEKFKLSWTGVGEELFLVVSFDVMSSLKNNEDLDKDNPAINSPYYWALRAAFENWKANEPPLNIVEGGSQFSLFTNPDIQSRILSEIGGELNVLGPFVGDEGTTYESNEALNEKLTSKRIPVFNYGLKNSNILNFKFDLKPWYAHLLNILPVTYTNGLLSRVVQSLDLTKNFTSWYNGGPAPPRQTTKKELLGSVEVFPDLDAPLGTLFQEDPDIPSGDPPKDLREALEAWWDNLNLEDDRGRPEHETRATWDAQSIVDLGRATLPDLPPRELFVLTMMQYLSATAAGASVVSDYLPVNPENQDGITDTLLTIRNKLATRTFTGTITTIPLFTMMSVAKTLGTTALLYFVEPEIMAPAFREGGARSTWLSGEYYIVGYSCTITGSEVQTTFDLMKNPDKAGGMVSR